MKKNPDSAFSLVEVTLALGVAAFCLLAIFGLLPVGLQSNQTSVEQTAAAGIARTILSDLRSTTPLTTGTSPRFSFKIPAAGGTASGNTPQMVYFTEDGNTIGTGIVGNAATVSGTTTRYLASVGFTPPTPASNRTTTAVRVLITWPALANGSNTTAWPTKFSGSYEIVTALDRN